MLDIVIMCGAPIQCAGGGFQNFAEFVKIFSQIHYKLTNVFAICWHAKQFHVKLKFFLITIEDKLTEQQCVSYVMMMTTTTLCAVAENVSFYNFICSGAWSTKRKNSAWFYYVNAVNLTHLFSWLINKRTTYNVKRIEMATTIFYAYPFNQSKFCCVRKCYF